MAKSKYIETPSELWELFCEYKEEVKANPIKKHVFVGKDGDSEKEKRERPLTMEGFENFVADKDGYPNDLGDYLSNKNEAYGEYSTICSRIKRSIRQDQIEGGMAGIYNPSITQRLNGLAEKVEESKSVTLLNIDPLAE